MLIAHVCLCLCASCMTFWKVWRVYLPFSLCLSLSTYMYIYVICVSACCYTYHVTCIHIYIDIWVFFLRCSRFVKPIIYEDVLMTVWLSGAVYYIRFHTQLIFCMWDLCSCARLCHVAVSVGQMQWPYCLAGCFSFDVAVSSNLQSMSIWWCQLDSALRKSIVLPNSVTPCKIKHEASMYNSMHMLFFITTGVISPSLDSRMARGGQGGGVGWEGI